MGVGERTVGAPARSSMEVERVGFGDGLPVMVDRWRGGPTASRLIRQYLVEPGSAGTGWTKTFLRRCAR